MNNKMTINIYLSIIESKKPMNKQNRNRIIDTEKVLMVVRWEGYWRIDEKGEGIEYKLVVME